MGLYFETFDCERASGSNQKARCKTGKLKNVSDYTFYGMADGMLCNISAVGDW